MSKVNSEQMQAINSNSCRILCLAGAGAGKTFSMIQRVLRLVSDGVSPDSILVLTFTNAAAIEMRNRYLKSQSCRVKTPEFRTFHSFAYYLVCRDSDIREAMGYHAVPNIASDSQEYKIHEKAMVQCKIKIPKDKLTSRQGLTKQERFSVELFDKAVKRMLKSEGLITFDILNNEVSTLFKNNHPSTLKYKNKYKHIIVDEFQDTDQHQMDFIQSFGDANFYLCGDCLQNIYAFRGTSNAYIKVLSQSPDWEIIKLNTNYRSTNQICTYANKFSSKYADSSYRIEMVGTRDGEDVVSNLYDPPIGYSLFDDKLLHDLLENISEGTTAVLCRTNKEVDAVCSFLKSHNVDCTSNQSSTSLTLIQCALSDTYLLDILSSLLSTSKYAEYIRISSSVKSDISKFLSMYGTDRKIKKLNDTVQKLRVIVTKFGSVSDKLTDISQLLNIDKITLPDSELYGDDLLKYVQSQLTDIKSTELYVGTIHSVKGLEFDNVHVLNVNSLMFRLTTEEMKNLFYVAVTRAKSKLFVYKVF